MTEEEKLAQTEEKEQPAAVGKEVEEEKLNEIAGGFVVIPPER